MSFGASRRPITLQVGAFVELAGLTPKLHIRLIKAVFAYTFAKQILCDVEDIAQPVPLIAPLFASAVIRI